MTQTPQPKVTNREVIAKQRRGKGTPRGRKRGYEVRWARKKENRETLHKVTVPVVKEATTTQGQGDPLNQPPVELEEEKRGREKERVERKKKELELQCTLAFACMHIKGYAVDTIIDTGLSRSLVSATRYKGLNLHPKIKKTDKRYQNVSGDRMKVLGKAKILIEIVCSKIHKISCVIIWDMIIDVIIGNDVLRDRGKIDFAT